ncbi:hypothetical protein ACWDBO_22590 [Streptomyces mirabilis]|uniref:hypothetical protein n=1 Tax=Streptomyces mirabilis TaxID=68239 RepID=UPI00331F2D96
MGMPQGQQRQDVVFDVLAQAAQLVVGAAQSDWWNEFEEAFFKVVLTEQSTSEEVYAVIQRLTRTRKRVTSELPLAQHSNVMAAEVDAWEKVLRQSPLLRNQTSGRLYLERLNRLLDHFEARPGAGIVIGLKQDVRPGQGVPVTADETVAAATTIDDALARLFVRLGPPPEPTVRDYTPVGSGDGGVEQ